jgi:hypothetical protein
MIYPPEITKKYAHDELKGVSVLFINMPLRESAMPVVAPEGPAILAAVLRKSAMTRFMTMFQSWMMQPKC